MGDQAATDRAYHHGNLRSTLIDVASGLIAEKGASGFSLAEASRRADVSVAAPYRHFANREELVAAVAAQGYERIAAAIGSGSESGAPTDRLAAAAGAYVRFVGEHPEVFDAIFSSGLDKRRHPELLAAGAAVFAAFLGPASELAGDDGERLGITVGMLAHGYAAAARDRLLGSVDEAVAGVEAGTRALARGRRVISA